MPLTPEATDALILYAAALERALRDAVDKCPVCRGTGQVTRQSATPDWEQKMQVRTHCDYCWDMREALRRAGRGA